MTGGDQKMLTLGISLVVGVVIGYSFKANMPPDMDLADELTSLFDKVFNGPKGCGCQCCENVAKAAAAIARMKMC